jgi:Tfp pilus assembly protein PilF
MLKALVWMLCVYLALTLFAGCAMEKTPPLRADSKPSPADLKPLQCGPEMRIDARTYYAAGQLLEPQGNLEAAAQRYQQAIQADPSMLDAYNSLGLVYARLGQFDQAHATLRLALNRAPDQAALHNNLAFVYMLQHQYDNAEAQLNNALSIDPSYARAKMNLAIVFAKQERYDQAFDRFLQVCPPYQAHYNLGVLYQNADKKDLARQSFKKAIAIRPDFIAAKQALADLDHPTTAPAPAAAAQITK